jgi:hypothetical protein
MATDIKIYSKKITPAEAQEYLTKNNHSSNRRISERNVSFLLAEMQNGNWITTGDPIQFNRDGQLINGQHRLTAIIKHGKPVEMFIAEGVPNNAFKVMDTGKMRSAGDALAIMGYKNCFNVAGITRHILMIKSNRYNNTGRMAGCSISDIVAFADANKKLLQDIIHEMNEVYRPFKYASPSMLGDLSFFFQKKDSEKSWAFWEKYSSGIDLGATNPIRFLREKLIQNKLNKTQYNHRDMMALHIFAWNAFREGKKVTSFGLAKNYEFPKIK